MGLTHTMLLLLGNQGGISPVTIAGPLAITPELGSNIIVNGGFEDWASATDLSNWTEQLSGSSTINRDDTTVHSGNYAMRIDKDASGSGAFIYGGVPLNAGTWYLTSIWMKCTNIANVQVRGATGVSRYFNPDATFREYVIAERATTSSITALISGGTTASTSIYYDDFAFQPITLSSILGILSTKFVPRVISAKITRTTFTQAGVVHYQDDDNFVTAYLDGLGGVVLLKRVAGTYTQVALQAIAYSAGTLLELHYDPTAKTYTIKYDGATIINAASVTDDVFTTASGAGIFSTYVGNTFEDFEANPSPN